MGRALRSVLCGVLVLLAGGCFKAEQDLVVRADGGGSFRLHVVVNLQAFEQLGASFGSLGSPIPSTGTTSTTPMLPLGRRELATGGTVSVERDGPRLLMDARFPFDDPAGFDRKLVEVSRALDSPDSPFGRLPTGGTLRVARHGDLVDIAFRPNDGGSASTGDMSGLNDVLREDLKPRVSVSITAPGRIRTTNADEVRGTTARWDLLRPGAPTTLSVTAEASAAIDWVPLLGAALFLVAVAAFVLVGVGRVRVRTSARPAPQAGSPPIAPPAPMPPPTAQPPGRDPLQTWPDRPAAPDTSDEER